jgi:hypothetical protein
MATTDQPSESSDQTGEAVADTGQLELSDLSDQTGEAVADIGQLKAQYLTKGVVLVTKTSNKYQCVLVCDRGDQYKNSRNLSNEERKRRGTTRRIGCSFEIVCRLRDGQWHIEKITGEHNHALPNNLAGHAVGRAPKPEEREKILSLSNQGIAPKFIKAVLRTDFANSLITDQDIYNIKKAARNQFLQGRTPMEALIDMVSTNDYFSKILIENNVVCGVFFMHKNSIELAKLYNTVFLMDCTYKPTSSACHYSTRIKPTSSACHYSTLWEFLPFIQHLMQYLRFSAQKKSLIILGCLDCLLKWYHCQL